MSLNVIKMTNHSEDMVKELERKRMLETTILDKSILKIGEMISLVLGQTGSAIIQRNLRSN